MFIDADSSNRNNYTASQDFLSKSGSIWANVQMQQSSASGMRSQTVRSPANWDELKLALSAPLSQRYFDSKASLTANANDVGLTSFSATRDQTPSAPHSYSASHSVRSARSAREFSNTPALLTRARNAKLSSSLPTLGFRPSTSAASSYNLSPPNAGPGTAQLARPSTTMSAPHLNESLSRKELRAMKVRELVRTLEPIVKDQHKTKVEMKAQFSKLLSI